MAKVLYTPGLAQITQGQPERLMTQFQDAAMLSDYTGGTFGLRTCQEVQANFLPNAQLICNEM